MNWIEWLVSSRREYTAWSKITDYVLHVLNYDIPLESTQVCLSNELIHQNNASHRDIAVILNPSLMAYAYGNPK